MNVTSGRTQLRGLSKSQSNHLNLIVLGVKPKKEPKAGLGTPRNLNEASIGACETFHSNMHHG